MHTAIRSVEKVLPKWIFRGYCTLPQKLSYIHNFGKEPLRPLTIGKLLEEQANKFPDINAIISKPQNLKMTYQDLLVQADKLAAGLTTLNFNKGDRVSIWAPNMMQWVVTKMACARAGLILVPLNPFYEAPEVEYCVNKVGVKGIICLDVAKHISFYNILDDVVQGLQNGEPGNLKSKKVPSLKTVITVSDKTMKGTFNYNEVLDMASSRSVKNIKANQHFIQPDDIAAVQFSSGTTGKPKATKTTHFNEVNNSYYVGKRIKMDNVHQTVCIQVPLFHALGMSVVLMSLINFGSTGVLPSLFYDPVENLNAIKDQNCTVIFGTPTMYIDLVNKQRKMQFNINPEIAVNGGAPCSPVLFKQIKEVLNAKKVASVYGLTETLITFQSLPTGEDENKTTQTVGCLEEHMEAKVVDHNGKMVPFGTPGELYIRSYSNMLGYWNDEVKTKEIIGADRWLQTGDQFILQEDGYGRIIGRLKDMIIRGGENIFLKEIEDFLNTHPDIIECHVIGFPHERLGEEICACVRVFEGSNLTIETLTEYCKGKLAKYKIPTVLKIVKSFPKTQSGKIQKFILRKIFSSESKP